MKERLEAIRERALAQINETDSLDKLNDIRVAFLGKKGELTEVLKGMKEVAPEDRPKVGQIVNETRQAIEEVLDKAKTELAAKKRELQLKSEVIDVTLPSKRDELGHKHPNTLALEEIQKIFIGMGYEVVDGPEVEYDYYNFEALNIPANHPSKDSFNLSSASYSISQIRSQIYSPSRIFVIFQSAMAVYFPNRSPTPDAVSLIGASVMIRLSATTKIGDSAIMLFLNPYHDIAATVDT